MRESVREAEVSRGEDLLIEAEELSEAAMYREQWYPARQLTGYRFCRGRLEFLGLLKNMVIDGAGWDIVDNCHPRFAHLLWQHRDTIDPMLRAPAVDPNHWKRRIAIITQLSTKEGTDVALLEAVILPNMTERDFFLRKALGWALREYARIDSTWVCEFVARHQGELSGLTRREALKHVGIR